MTDEEERSRYCDDALLVGTEELLMVVDGRLMVVPEASNTVEEPLEPVQGDVLLVLLAATGKSAVKETYPLEVSASDEGQGGSLENKEFVKEPSTPATNVVEKPLERDEAVAGAVDGLVTSQQQPATPAYRCSVYGCGEVAIVHSEDAEEEERTYGLWCTAHQDRSEAMRLGMLLDPAYPRVEYVLGHTLCEGREAWLRFHLHAQSRVGIVRRHVHQLLEAQFDDVQRCETA
jgi:hypothetical protein